MGPHEHAIHRPRLHISCMPLAFLVSFPIVSAVGSWYIVSAVGSWYRSPGGGNGPRPARAGGMARVEKQQKEAPLLIVKNKKDAIIYTGGVL